MELVQSVLAIVAFVRAHKWGDAAIIAFRLAAQLLEQLTGPNVVGSAVVRKVEDSGQTCESLCDDLEAACAPKAAGGADISGLPPLVLPILLLLLKKLLEQLTK